MSWLSLEAMFPNLWMRRLSLSSNPAEVADAMFVQYRGALAAADRGHFAAYAPARLWAMARAYNAWCKQHGLNRPRVA
jgi:hypothetical protein